MTFSFEPKNFLLLYLTENQVLDVQLFIIVIIILALIFLLGFLMNWQDKRKYKKMYSNLLEQYSKKEVPKNVASSKTASNPELAEITNSIKELSKQNISTDYIDKKFTELKTDISNTIQYTPTNSSQVMIPYEDLREISNSLEYIKNIINKSSESKPTPNNQIFLSNIPDTNSKYILCNSLYVIEGKRQCFKCQTQTNVIALATDDFIKNGIRTHSKEKLYILGYINEIKNNDLVDFLNRAFGYYYCYSKQANDYSYANHCNKCRILQGNYYLHDEPTESPFYFDSDDIRDISKASKINLYKTKIPLPIEIDAEITSWQPDYSELIKTYAAEYKEISF